MATVRRKKLSPAKLLKRAIRNRLARLCKHKLKVSQVRFGESLGVGDGAEAWFKKKGRNSLPKPETLIRMGVVHRVNLNWLLLNEGQPLRRKSTRPIQDAQSEAHKNTTDPVKLRARQPMKNP